MREDEFNVEKVINEGENPDFEYGNTQDEESTSYFDNNDRLRDEVNDNPVNNGTTPPKKEKKKRRECSSRKKPEQTPESSISSSTATVATVVGAATVSITTLSALVGINLFFNATCKMNRFEPTTNSIVYELDLADIQDDQCIITLENHDYSESQELIEGINTGEFVDLIPSTEYHVSVIDVSYNNYVLFEDDISTKAEEVPPLDRCVVTFDANSGAGEQDSDYGYVGQEYILPECTFTAPDGYAFDTWQLSGTDETYDPGEGYLVENQDAVTFIALWAEDVPPLQSCVVTFDANGGDGEQNPDQGYVGQEYILPKCTFTAPAGYAFDCWQLSGTEETYESGEGYLIESQDTVTFIALWGEATTLEFFPGQGAQGSVTSIDVVIGKQYTMPSGEDLFVAPENQEFNYWFDDMYSENVYAGDVITIEDTNYYFTARWKYFDGLTFTVMFDTNGGSEIEPQVVNAGTSATKPDNPTKENYTFKGWYSDPELTDTYGFHYPVTSDITIYAKWEVTTFTASFETNGGPEIDPQTVEINGTVTQPDDPPRENYAFEGWFSDSELTEEYDFATPVTSDITIYAKWSTTYSASGEDFAGFPNSTVPEATESEVNGVTLEVGPYSCYYLESGNAHGIWLTTVYENDQQNGGPYLANKTPINGAIKSVAITVDSSKYGGDSNASLLVSFGTSPILGSQTEGGVAINYGESATEVFEANVEGCSYFNISNLSEEDGLVIESIVITYYVNN